MSYLRQDFYQVGPGFGGNGRISTFFNVKKIYESRHEEIKEEGSADPLVKDFPFMSYTLKDGILIEMQAKFELMKSMILPENQPEPSSFFWVLNIRVSLQNKKGDFELERLVLNLTFENQKSLARSVECHLEERTLNAAR